LQKQQSTGLAKAVLPPSILLQVHVVVRDPARACETPHVAVCWEHGVVWQLSRYSTHGHIGCVGDGVGGTVTHDGSVYLQALPGTSTGAGVASKLISKVVRVVKTVGFVASAWPMVLRTMPRNALSWFSSLCLAAPLPSPQPPTASRKQSAKCRLSGLLKVGSSKVSPQQSQIVRQSSKSIEWLFEFILFQRSGQS